MRKTCIILLFLFHFLGNVFPQTNKVDSLIEMYHTAPTDSLKLEILVDLTWALIRVDHEMSAKLVDTAYILIEKSGVKDMHHYFDYVSATLFGEEGEFQKQRDYMWRYIEYHRNKGDDRRVGNAFGVIASSFLNEAVFDSSLFYNDLALRSYEKIGFQRGIILSQRKTGDVLVNMGRPEDALKYYQAGINACEEHQETTYLGSLYNSCGVAYEELEVYDQAIQFYQKAEKEYEEEGDLVGQVTCMLNIAGVYNDTDNWITAKEKASRAFEIALQNSNPENQIMAMIDLGYSTGMLGEPGGTEQLEEGLRKAKEYDFKLETEVAESRLQNLYAHRGEYEKAYQISRQLNENLMSKYTANVSQQVNKLEAMMRLTEQEKKLAEAEAENAIGALALAQSKNRNNLLLAGLAGLLLIGLFGYQRYNDRKKNEIKLIEKNDVISNALREKEILLGEIHHRVKNNLQVVSSLLNLQERTVDDQMAKKALVEGRTRIKAMAMIHEKLYQSDNLVGVNTTEYIDQLVHHLFRTYRGDEKHIQLHTDIEELYLDAETIIPLGLILNELISNALKHAFVGKEQGNLSIVLEEIGDQLIVKIKDDGVGIQPRVFENSRSMGSKIVKAFAQKLQASLEVVNDHGTEMKLTIDQYRALKAA